MARGVKSESQEARLTGKRIVVTRPQADARKLATRLEALGARPIVAPAINIEFTDPPELDAALAVLATFDWIVFTSKNGVEAVFRRIDRITGPRVAAIGPATAEALRRWGTEPDVIPREYVAEAVLAALGDVAGQRFLLPRANIARRALADGLRERGAEVHEVAAYRTHTSDARPEFEDIDAVTFTSSSTVRGFLEGGPVPQGAKVICIGPVTAQTAQEHGLEVTAVAQEYTETGLIAALLTALSP